MLVTSKTYDSDNLLHNHNDILMSMHHDYDQGLH